MMMQILPAILGQRGATVHMPPQHSTVSPEVDWLFYFVFWISVFFTLLIAGLIVYFAIKYRQRPGRREGEHTHTHHTALEMTWTIIPLVIVIFIFFVGFRGYVSMAIAPDDAYVIDVTGFMWDWNFEYPNGAVSDTLYVPAERPVKLRLHSDDVIHSVFIPAFRVKKDAVPDMFNTLWFEAVWDQEYVDYIEHGDGELMPAMVHHLFCTEYCGQGHAVMNADVVVLQLPDFRRVLEDLGEIDLDQPPVQVGEQLVAQRCSACHQVEADTQGPAYGDLFGGTFTYQDGQERTVDAEHVRRSILNPNWARREGFATRMPSFEGILGDYEIYAITQYFKSVSDAHDEEVAESFPETEEEVRAYFGLE